MINKQFEDSVSNIIGHENVTPEEMYSALTNIRWENLRTGEEVFYSFEQAAALIAEVTGSGDYLDWYRCAKEGGVSAKIEKTMAKSAWAWRSAVPPVMNTPRTF